MHKIQQKIVDLSQSRDISKLSLSEIAALIGVKSPQIVKYHKDRLRDLGYNLDGETHASSSLSGFELISIPIVGMADCGPATIFADERIEGYLKLSSRLLDTRKRDGLFALRARGRSMNRARVHGEPINDGDYVIVDSTSQQPNPGDYVVAVVDGLANIKRYYFDPMNNQVALISESTDDYTPIFLHETDQYDAVIAGKVIQVVNTPTM